MESDEKLDDEDLVLVIKNFKSFLNKSSNAKKGETNHQKASGLMCFKCRKFGHIKADCLLNKDKRRRLQPSRSGLSLWGI